MNKIFVSAIMILLALMASGALALEPCPIAIQAKTSPAAYSAGLKASLEYQRGGSTILLSGMTNNYGEIVWDVGDKVDNCQTTGFKLTFTDCVGKYSQCTQYVYFNPKGYTEIDLTKVDWALIRPEPEECLTMEDCNKLIVPCNCQSCCPYCPMPEEEGYILPEDCPIKEEWNETSILIALFAIIEGGLLIYVSKGKLKLKKGSIDKLVAAFPKGCGIRLFRAYTGVSTVKHFHRSPKNYHNLEQKHKGIYDHKGEENLFPDLDKQGG